MKLHHLTIFCCAIFAQSLFAQSQPTDRLTPEKLWQLGRVALFDVSPDGKSAVYGLSYYNIEANKGNRDLYLISTDGSSNGKPRQLTNFEGNENDAAFIAGGSKIAYLRGGKLWEMGLGHESVATKLSELDMNGFKFSPDGRKLLYIADVKYDKTTQDAHPDLKKASGKVIDGLTYRHWNEWEDGLYSNVFVADYTDGKITGQPTNIMGEPFDTPLKPDGGMEQIAWDDKGQRIAYTCKKLSGTAYATSTNSDVFIYDLSTKKTINISEGMGGYDMNPAFSPDGKYLLWESQETPGYEADRHRVMVYDFAKKTMWEATAGLDRNATSPAWSPDGQRIIFQSTEAGTEQLYSIEMMGNGLKQITAGQFNFGPFVVGKNGIVTTRCSMADPHELFTVPLSGGRDMQLTYTNKDLLGTMKFGKVEKRMIKATDGQPILTWVAYPPDFDPTKKYPTLLYCQGGPQNGVTQFWSYRWNLQLMASNGYIVVAPNRRGLPGFGQKWNDDITGDWGGQAMQDLLSAIDDVATEPYVNKDALGAVGASFGGYSAYWLAGNHQKRFKAFISHCGMFNMESWYGTTEELFFADHDLEGPYWNPKAGETWKLDSPHKYVDKWDTPMLVIHGGLDFRVPESEGMQAFQAAQLKGVPSKFLYFPDEGHWVMQPQNSLLWQREFFGWLDRWLKNRP
jgi:dipeptidyl aminopeptidase/acylaminoacyl peptidase